MLYWCFCSFIPTENHRGQLGLGDDVSRNGPVEVEALKKKKIVHAATGKAHTIFITDGGEVYACGDNKFGAVGPTPKAKQVR
jgi:alpha-tubulin suppressor-like RCC1 family protein